MSRGNSGRCSLLVALFVLFSLSLTSVGLATTVLDEARGENGMVATANRLASQVGVDVLKAGGNAIDAAISTAFAISVLEPNASGLGGEGFMVIYFSESDRAVSIDYRSAAPIASADDLVGQRMPTTGWKSAAVPGIVAGLSMALEKYGTMTWTELLAPAIRFAEEGFAVTDALAGTIESNYTKILANPAMSAVYLDDMLPPEPGFILTNPDLANSLRIIAAKGPDAFYTGEIGQAIMDDVQAFGGYMTMEDLANYQAILRPPVRGNYRGYEILSAGPPVGGSTVIEALHILENFDVASLGYPSAQAIHLTAEAIRIAYRDNYEYLGDPDFDNVPIDDLLGKHYARDRALEIDPNRMKTKDDILPGYFGVASVVHAGADYVPHESPSTTHISIVDKDQNMVSLTQTIGSFFGAGVMPEGTGIVLNNELANFEAVDAGVNALRASKRMKTCISPTIVLKNGEPFLAIGTPGAGRIISTLTILLSALIDHGMTLQEAIEAPRFYVRDTHDNIEFESRLSSDTLSILRAKGWGLLERSEFDLYFGGVQGVLLDLERGELVGGTDPRRGGAALGY